MGVRAALYATKDGDCLKTSFLKRPVPRVPFVADRMKRGFRWDRSWRPLLMRPVLGATSSDGSSLPAGCCRRQHNGGKEGMPGLYAEKAFDVVSSAICGRNLDYKNYSFWFPRPPIPVSAMTDRPAIKTGPFRRP